MAPAAATKKFQLQQKIAKKILFFAEQSIMQAI